MFSLAWFGQPKLAGSFVVQWSLQFQELNLWLNDFAYSLWSKYLSSDRAQRAWSDALGSNQPYKQLARCSRTHTSTAQWLCVVGLISAALTPWAQMGPVLNFSSAAIFCAQVLKVFRGCFFHHTPCGLLDPAWLMVDPHGSHDSMIWWMTSLMFDRSQVFLFELTLVFEPVDWGRCSMT
jgi:hypothetical protein